MRGAIPWLLAVALSLVLAAERLWAALSDLQGTLISDWNHPDCLGNHWLLVWVAERLSRGESLVHNTAYYWPFGDYPWLAGNGSEGVLYLPFHLLFGVPAAATLYLFAVMSLNGLAGYLLGRAAGAGPWASLVSGATASTLIYAVHHAGAGRFTQADIAWLLFALAAWLGLLAKPTRWRVVAAGATAAVAAALYWYHGVFFVMAATVIGLAQFARRRTLPWRHIGAAAALGAALVAPLLAVYLLNWHLIPGTSEVFPHPQAFVMSVDPGSELKRHVAQTQAIPVLILAAAALVRFVVRRRERWEVDVGLALAAGLFYWLGLGPEGHLYTLVYGLAEPLQRMWWPDRHLVIVGIALGVLAARALPAGPAWGLIAALSISPALRLQDAPIAVHSSAVMLPPLFYTELRRVPGDVMLQVPFSPPVVSTQSQLFYQLYHRKEMVNGHAPWVDRVRPPEWDAMVADNSFLAALTQLELGHDGSAFTFEPEDLQGLIDQGMTIVVVDQELFPLPLRPLYKRYGELFTALFGKPVLRAKRANAWDVSAWTGESSVPLDPWLWPATLKPGTGEMPLVARRSASPVFDVSTKDEDPPRRPRR